MHLVTYILRKGVNQRAKSIYKTEIMVGNKTKRTRMSVLTTVNTMDCQTRLSKRH